MASKTDRRAYTNRHTWVLPDEDKNIATVGITDYLTEELVAIQSIDMPLVGDELEMDTFCIHLHLAKRIHHLRSPLSGRVSISIPSKTGSTGWNSTIRTNWKC